MRKTTFVLFERKTKACFDHLFRKLSQNKVSVIFERLHHVAANYYQCWNLLPTVGNYYQVGISNHNLND